MSWDTARRSVDFLLEHSAEERDLEIVFFGGEPLLEFGLMQRIASYAEQRAADGGRRIRYALTTNGTIMTPDIARFAQTHGFNILLSIDGDRQSHDLHRKNHAGGGSWALVVRRNLQILKRYQGWIGARMTVAPDTAGRLATNVRVLHTLGVNQFLLGVATDADWTTDQLQAYAAAMHAVVELYAERKAAGARIRITDLDKTPADWERDRSSVWGCAAGRSKVAISTSGDIYPCARFVGAGDGGGNHDPFRLGSLATGLENIASRFELMDNRTSSRPTCAGCGLRATCAGGCPAVNYLRTGSVFQPCPVECEVARVWDAARAHYAVLRRSPGVAE